MIIISTLSLLCLTSKCFALQKMKMNKSLNIPTITAVCYGHQTIAFSFLLSFLSFVFLFLFICCGLFLRFISSINQSLLGIYPDIWKLLMVSCTCRWPDCASLTHDPYFRPSSPRYNDSLVTKATRAIHGGRSFRKRSIPILKRTKIID